jgi:O-methyltransferase
MGFCSRILFMKLMLAYLMADVLTKLHNLVASADDRELSLSMKSKRSHHVIAEYLEFFRDTIQNRHYERYGKHIYLYGSEWPEESAALSMIGARRLDHFVALIVTVIDDDIPGHIIETGVWRGGASFLAAKTIELVGESESRHVYMCDSFVGIPLPPAHLLQWKDDLYAHSLHYFNISGPSRVIRDAQLFGLDMSHIHIVEGYFNESLPKLIITQPDMRFSIIRLDGDTYFSTYDAIDALYPHLSPGGFVVVDDYSDWPGCRDAIDAYRLKHGISDSDEPLIMIPHQHGEIVRGVYWRKKMDRPLKQCVGDGTDPDHSDEEDGTDRRLSLRKKKSDLKLKQGKISRSALRVRNSYNPGQLVKMPPEGPANMTILGLQGKTNIRMCI